MRSESRRIAMMSITVILRVAGLFSTSETINSLADAEDAVARNRMRLARKIKSGDADF
jgi:hypothetical protein